ncbi:MAG: copper chaperone PCu(A)C [Devosia sp.]
MKFLAIPALLGLSLLATPSFAHMGMNHDGCPAGQTFTAGDLTISGGFSRATLPRAKVGGGYLTIVNAGATADRLVGGSSENARAVEIHEMKMEGDMMKMAKLPDGLEIPAGGTVELTPGGFHLMLLDIIQPLVAGECIEVTLQFEAAGAVPVQLNVGEINASAPEGH